MHAYTVCCWLCISGKGTLSMCETAQQAFMFLYGSFSRIPFLSQVWRGEKWTLKAPVRLFISYNATGFLAHLSHMYCMFLIRGARKQLQFRVGGAITVIEIFSNLLSYLLNLVMQIKSVTMWQLPESHWRMLVYKLTDVWQGVVTVCTCHRRNGITLPSVPDLSVLEGKIRRANSNMFVFLCASVEMSKNRWVQTGIVCSQVSLKMFILFMSNRWLCYSLKLGVVKVKRGVENQGGKQ